MAAVRHIGFAATSKGRGMEGRRGRRGKEEGKGRGEGRDLAAMR